MEKLIVLMTMLGVANCFGQKCGDARVDGVFKEINATEEFGNGMKKTTCQITAPDSAFWSVYCPFGPHLYHAYLKYDEDTVNETKTPTEKPISHTSCEVTTSGGNWKKKNCRTTATLLYKSDVLIHTTEKNTTEKPNEPPCVIQVCPCHPDAYPKNIKPTSAGHDETGQVIQDSSVSREKRVVQGKTVAIDEFPYYVSVRIKRSKRILRTFFKSYNSTKQYLRRSFNREHKANTNTPTPYQVFLSTLS